MTQNRTTCERKSDRELVTTRTFDGPPRLVYQAWTQPDLLMRWWVPKSVGITMLTCEVDARVGGKYRFEFGHPASDKPMAFFGKYLEVIPNARLVWTNEESEQASITTLTFTEQGGKTLLVLHELYPSKEVLDASMAEMGPEVSQEQHQQLDELLASLQR